MEKFYQVWLKRRFEKSSVEKELFDISWYSTVKVIAKNLALENKEMKLAEIGCGWGRIIIGIKIFFPRIKIIGYELLEDFCKIFEELKITYGLMDVEVIRKDVIESSLPKNEFDCIYSVRVLHYFSESERIKVLKKIYKALKPEGKIFISIPNAWNIYRKLTYKHAPLISIMKIKKEMKIVGFQNLKIGGYNFIPPVKRFSYDSFLSKINLILSFIPVINLAGGLVYVVGKKASGL